MTVPSTYETSKDYITDALDFLKSFQWLYNYNNTHILVNDIFTNFHPEWVQYFRGLTNEELNGIPLGITKQYCPNSLKQILIRIEKLKPSINSTCDPCDYNLLHNSGLSNKKLHEIISLAPVINTVCKENNSNCIIDVGAGLGYLSHLLNRKYNYRILGIDCSSEYIDLAFKNQNKYYSQLKNEVTFVEHFITKDSAETLRTISEKHFTDLQATCITGLHACADLSITILDLFAKLDFVKCLVIMPCCYHRIELDQASEGEERFKHFPASKLMKDAFTDFNAQTFIRRPFLRLACQQTIGSFVDMTEEEHDRHSRSCMYRAVLQEVATSENCQVRRLKRKSGKSHITDLEEDFQVYLHNLKSTHELELPTKEKLEVNDASFLKKMHEKWNEHKGNCYLLEVLTGLQASIQSICENIILLDRVEFLTEKGFRCYIEKVTNDRISPRCYALIATKE